MEGRIRPIVFVSPNDVLLINEGGVERRKFLDAFISMYNHEYFSNLLTYNKLLQQRNTLLKQEQTIDETYLSILDEKLSILGFAIYDERKKAVKELSFLTQKFYNEISTTEECSISYASQLHHGNMKEKHTLTSVQQPLSKQGSLLLPTRVIGYLTLLAEFFGLV